VVRHGIYPRGGLESCRERGRQGLHAPAAVVRALEARLEEWSEGGELWRVVAAVPEGPPGDAQAKVHVDGAVAPRTGRPHAQVRPESGTGERAQVLRHLLAAHPGNRRLGIPERGKQPQGAPVAAVVREAQGRRMRQSHPAYAPELTPPERVGKGLRRVVTPHHWWATLAAPIDAVRNCLRSLAGVQDQGRPLCGFQPPGSLAGSL
jgi:hypothetical protein